MQKKILRILPLIITLLLLFSCDHQNSGDTMAAGSFVDKKIETDEKQKELVILTEKEKFEKDFGEGAYLEDYTETINRLTDEATDYYKEYFSSVMNEDEILLVEPDLYYTMYRKAREENLSYQNIVEDYEDYIDEVKLLYVAFYDENEFKDSVEIKSKSFERHYKLDEVYEGELGKKYFDTSVLLFEKKYTREMVALQSEKLSITNMIVACQTINRNSVFIITDDGSSDLYANFTKERPNVKYYLQELSEKYQETFAVIPGEGEWLYYAPILRPELYFELQVQDARYTSVFAEDWIYKNVENIIEKYDAQNNIAAFVAVNAEPTKAYDMPSYVGNEKALIDNVDCFLSLYYVVNPGETFDLELIRDVLYEAQSYMPPESQRSKYYVQLYFAKENERLTFLKLLRSNHLTENYIRETTMGTNWEITRNDSEAFRYLDCFAEKEAYMYKTFGEISKDVEINKYFNNRKYINEFKEWED